MAMISMLRRLLQRATVTTNTTMVRWMSTDEHRHAKNLPLYRRLSALGKREGSGGSVKDTMNKWVREGRRARGVDIAIYAKRLSKYGRYKHALELLEWMDSKGMNMSYQNHAFRMQLISKLSGVEMAEKYFNDLPEAAKNRLTYGALMNIYCAEKMRDKAVSLFKALKGFGYDSDTLIYNNLMNLFVKTAGCLDKVLPLHEEMKEKKIPMDSFTYSILITYHATLGDMKGVDTAVLEMEADHHTSCQRWPTYSNVASIYISAGCNDKAQFSLKRLEHVMDRKDRAAYHHLISLHARLGDSEEVKRVWGSLRESLTTTNKSYLVFLQALDKLNDFDALVGCFREWSSSSHLSYDVWLVNVMIGAYLQRGMIDEAKSLVESAAARGAEPDMRTFQLFFDYYIINGDIESAVRCFETAASKSYELKMDKSAVELILHHLGEKDKSRANAFERHVKEHDGADLQRPTSTNVGFEDLDEEEHLMMGE